MVKIRLTRAGAKKRPFYRLIAIDASVCRRPFIEGRAAATGGHQRGSGDYSSQGYRGAESKSSLGHFITSVANRRPLPRLPGALR